MSVNSTVARNPGPARAPGDCNEELLHHVDHSSAPVVPRQRVRCRGSLDERCDSAECSLSSAVPDVTNRSLRAVDHERGDVTRALMSRTSRSEKHGPVCEHRRGARSRPLIARRRPAFAGHGDARGRADLRFVEPYAPRRQTATRCPPRSAPRRAPPTGSPPRTSSAPCRRRRRAPGRVRVGGGEQDRHRTPSDIRPAPHAPIRRHPHRAHVVHPLL